MPGCCFYYEIRKDFSYIEPEESPFCGRVGGWLEYGQATCFTCADRLKLVRVVITDFRKEARALSTKDHEWKNPPMGFQFNEIKAVYEQQLGMAGIKAIIRNTTIPKLGGVFELTVRTTAREPEDLDKIQQAAAATFLALTREDQETSIDS